MHLAPLIPAIRDLLASLATLAICAVSGALNAPPRARRALCIAVAALTLIAPWLASPIALTVRVLCAGGTALAIFRNLDIYRDRRPWSAVQRIIHLICVLDSRRFKRVSPHFDGRSWLLVGAFGAPTAISAWMLGRIGIPSSVAGYCLRWLCATLWVYTSFETLAASTRAGCRLVGLQSPKLHDNPILSRTLLEFWSQRWNLSVHYLLRDHCFRPLARRAGLAVAMMGTFAASALLHFWLVLAAGGLSMALSMATFFLIQGVFMVVERRAGVRHWRLPLQRAWTASCVLLPLPLLLEPLLRVIFG